MKILFYDLDGFERNYLLENIPKQIEPYYFDFPLSDNTKIIGKYSDCRAVSVFINSNLTSETLSKFRNLKYIFLRSTGYSHVDINYCKNNNIEIYNVPTYGSRTVAEYAFALILSLSRKVTQSKINLQNAEIIKTELTGFDLTGKTLGLIGTGNIGKEIIKISSGFNLKILAYDINHSVDNIKYTDIKTLLNNSDIIVIACLLDDSTRKLINNSTISYIKKGAVLINIARGEIVDTEAIYQALLDKKLSAVALDTIECEQNLCALYGKCSIEKHLREKCLKKFLFIKKLLKMDNVIITPHNAYNTAEAKIRILNSTINNIQSVLKNNNSGTKISFQI